MNTQRNSHDAYQIKLIESAWSLQYRSNAGERACVRAVRGRRRVRVHCKLNSYHGNPVQAQDSTRSPPKQFRSVYDQFLFSYVLIRCPIIHHGVPALV
jgi:hypothetical protein